MAAGSPCWTPALQRCYSRAGWVYTSCMWAASGCRALVQCPWGCAHLHPAGSRSRGSLCLRGAAATSCSADRPQSASWPTLRPMTRCRPHLSSIPALVEANGTLCAGLAPTPEAVRARRYPAQAVQQSDDQGFSSFSSGERVSSLKFCSRNSSMSLKALVAQSGAPPASWITRPVSFAPLQIDFERSSSKLTNGPTGQ
jgi:hypothetical protein